MGWWKLARRILLRLRLATGFALFALPRSFFCAKLVPRRHHVRPGSVGQQWLCQASGALIASVESRWVEMVRRGSLQAAKDWRRDALDEPSGGQSLPASIRHLRAVPISRTAQFAFSADHLAARARADARS